LIEEYGVVVSLDREGGAWVETQRHSTCSGCSLKQGCGGGVLSQVLGRRRNIVWARNEAAAAVGDRVVLSLAEHALLRGSVMVYLVPLFAMFVGAVLGDSAFGSIAAGGEGPALLWGTAGLAAGFFWVWRFGKSAAADERYQPIIARALPSVGGHAPAATTVAGENQ